MDKVHEEMKSNYQKHFQVEVVMQGKLNQKHQVLQRLITNCLSVTGDLPINSTNSWNSLNAKATLTYTYTKTETDTKILI